MGPLSKQPCAYFAFTTTLESEQRTSGGVRQPTSRVVSTNTQAVPFFVEDASGRSRVSLDPETALVDARRVVDTFEPMPVEARGPGEAFGDLVADLLAGEQTTALGYRSVELILPLDEPIVIIGVVQEYGWGADCRKGIAGPATALDPSGKLIVSCRASAEEAVTRLWLKRHQSAFLSPEEILADLFSGDPDVRPLDRGPW